MKTKVIAFRVTEQEYDAILLGVKTQADEPKVADYIRRRLNLPVLIEMLEGEKKRLEARAKRAAKKAAAAQVVPGD